MKKVIRLTESDLKRIVRRVLNEDVDPTTPTGVADSSGEYITLDKNSSLGILDGTEYRLHNSDPVFKNYNTTKKIPNGVDYNLRIVKIIDGFKVNISDTNDLTIKDGKLIGNTWEDLFSKCNEVSLNGPNSLTSDKKDIFQSLLDNTVPCFEIGKETWFYVAYDFKTGTIEYVSVELNSKCDEKIKYLSLNFGLSEYIYTYMNDGSANTIWDGNDLKFEKSLDGTSNLIIVEPPNGEVIPTPNNNTIPTPNNNTTPTGVADSNGDFLTLDKNSSLGILDGTNYFLWNADPVFKNYNTTKKIPNGVEYYLIINKIIDGIDFVIGLYDNLTIKDGKLIGNTWEDLFSKFNKVSLNGPNDLLFDEDYIFQSLLKNKVPCFEINKEKTQDISIDDKTGIVRNVWLYLNSKCDEKITNCVLNLDSSDGVYAYINNEPANVIWNGKDLKFEKSTKSKLIIKVNESIRKILRSYFYS